MHGSKIDFRNLQVAQHRLQPRQAVGHRGLHLRDRPHHGIERERRKARFHRIDAALHRRHVHLRHADCRDRLLDGFQVHRLLRRHRCRDGRNVVARRDLFHTAGLRQQALTAVGNRLVLAAEPPPHQGRAKRRREQHQDENLEKQKPHIL